MNVENLIKDEARKLKNSRREIEIAPEINTNHVAKIQKKYDSSLTQGFEKYILVLSYTNTGFFYLTGDSLCFDNFSKDGFQKVNFKDIQNITIHQSQSLFKPDLVELYTKHGNYDLDACIDGINLVTLKAVFDKIIESAKSSDQDFTVSQQGILSAGLPADIKLLYLKILCNYSYLNDSIMNPGGEGTIDASEYNALIKFSIRMELPKDERTELQKYMSDINNREKTGHLLKLIKLKTSENSGYWDAVKYSILQDSLFIREINFAGRSWKEDAFIGSLMEHCGLHMAQIETMIKAIRLNKEMMVKDADISKLRNEWDKLIDSVKNTDAYVPTPYLFCSGSVYGIKSYDGFLKSNERSQKAINKQRELILQELIMNNQKTVNALIMDMNYLADRLEAALKNEQNVQEQYKNIEQLMKKLRLAVDEINQNDEYASSESDNEG